MTHAIPSAALGTSEPQRELDKLINAAWGQAAYPQDIIQGEIAYLHGRVHGQKIVDGSIPDGAHNPTKISRVMMRPNEYRFPFRIKGDQQAGLKTRFTEWSSVLGLTQKQLNALVRLHNQSRGDMGGMVARLDVRNKLEAAGLTGQMAMMLAIRYTHHMGLAAQLQDLRATRSKLKTEHERSARNLQIKGLEREVFANVGYGPSWWRYKKPDGLKAPGHTAVTHQESQDPQANQPKAAHRTGRQDRIRSRKRREARAQ